MRMNVIRTLQPVGQGGFYTEHFIVEGTQGLNEELYVVYDCGSENKAKLNASIRAAIPQNKEIEILFISHFDSDHVNGIKELRRHHAIKRVVMPQIDGLEWYYILTDSINHNKDADYAIIRDLKNAVQGIPAIQVSPFDAEEEIERQWVESPVAFDDIPDSRMIPSGTILPFTQFRQADWIFMPVNSGNGQLISQLKRHLEKLFAAQMGVGSIGLSRMSDDIIPVINTYRKEINDIYRQYFGNANNASMLLYSGLKNASHTTTTRIHYYNSSSEFFVRRSYRFYPRHDKEACLYTGDANLLDTRQVRNIQSQISPLTSRIGLMQIPHHGSINNFSLSAYRALGVKHSVLFVSYGTRNKYGHPSTHLIGSLLTSGNPIASITECRDSAMYEVIEVL